MRRLVAGLACLLAVSAAALVAGTARGAERLGLADGKVARFDVDRLEPAGPAIEVAEPHTGPVLSPSGDRFAMGVSAAPAPGAEGRGRVGLWIGDPAGMRVVHAVQTGIASEAVAFPGVVAAALQGGGLVVVDPGTGAIRRRVRLAPSQCTPVAVRVGRVGVFVTRVRGTRRVEMATVTAAGRVRRFTIRLRAGDGPGSCRRAPLLADPRGGRALVVGEREVAVVDPASERAVLHPIGDRGGSRTAALLPGRRLVVAGSRGARALDLRRWRTRWRDRSARSVVASGGLAIVTGRGSVRAREPRTGRLRWRLRTPLTAASAAAGRVYLPSAAAEGLVVDARSGRRVGTLPLLTSDIEWAE